MDFKELVVSEIRRQEQRIEKLEHELETARTYLKAQRDMLRLLPDENGATGEDESSLRSGGDPAKVRDILKQAGKPLHIMELLSRLGKPQTPENRANLTGTLGAYVRKNRVFVKTAPNTFGLMGGASAESDEVPEGFGTPEADKKPAAPAAPAAKPAPNAALDEDVPF